MHVLYRAGILDPAVYRALRAAYVFLRRLIDALRLVRGRADDLVLPEAHTEEFRILARCMGYWEGPNGPAPTQSRQGQDSVPCLERDIVDQMQQAACVYETYFTVRSAA